VQQGTRDDPDRPRFASLLPGQHMDDVTLADALKLLSLPRDLGQMPDGTPISVGRGQFGPYVKFGAKYASINSFVRSVGIASLSVIGKPPHPKAKLP